MRKCYSKREIDCHFNPSNENIAEYFLIHYVPKRQTRGREADVSYRFARKKRRTEESPDAEQRVCCEAKDVLLSYGYVVKRRVCCCVVINGGREHLSWAHISGPTLRKDAGFVGRGMVPSSSETDTFSS